MSLSRNIKEKIRQSYVLPFLNCVREAGINDKGAIQTAITLFNKYETNIFSKNAFAQIEATDIAFQGNRLLRTAACHLSLLALGMVYLDYEFQEEEFAEENTKFIQKMMKEFGGDAMPEYVKEMLAMKSIVRIQTLIREICHEEINPIPNMAEQNIRSEIAETNGKEPIIAYALGVAIPRMIKNMFCGSTPKEEFSSEEIIKSIKRFTTVQLFPSLYQAIERANYMAVCRNSRVVLPIWAVKYIGNPDELKYGTVQYQYGLNRPIYAQLVFVSQESIVPLRSVLLLNRKIFGEYTIVKEVDLHHVPTNEDTKEKGNNLFLV